MQPDSDSYADARVSGPEPRGPIGLGLGRVYATEITESKACLAVSRGALSLAAAWLSARAASRASCSSAVEGTTVTSCPVD